MKYKASKSVFLLWTAGLVFIGAAVSAPASTFSDSLANGLNTNCWLLSETAAGLYSFDDTHNCFALAKTGTSPGGLQREVLTLNLTKLGGNIAGDFSTQVEFTNAVLPDTSGTSWNQVQFELDFLDGSFFLLRRTTNPDTVDVYSSVNGYVGDIGTTATAGTFSFVRSGTTLSGYFNGSLIYAESKTVPLTNVFYYLQNNNTDDAISVQYKNFSFTAVSVLPFLSVSPDTNNVLVSWPSGFTNFTLNATSNLTPPVAWAPVTNPAQISGGTISLTVNANQPTRFFRLEQATP